jgi:hypothetical protein
MAVSAVLIEATNVIVRTTALAAKYEASTTDWRSAQSLLKSDVDMAIAQAESSRRLVERS